MSTPLATALRESCGYLQDDGWQQTARLMSHAADEIERLSDRVRELESGTAVVRAVTRRPGRLSRLGARIAIATKRSRT